MVIGFLTIYPKPKTLPTGKAGKPVANNLQLKTHACGFLFQKKCIFAAQMGN